MPELETPQRPVPSGHALSPAVEVQRNAADSKLAEHAAEDVCTPSKAASEVDYEQLPEPSLQQAGGKRLSQKRLDLQQAWPVSLNMSGPACNSSDKNDNGQHAAMLAQLELQDKEVCITSSS